MASESPQLTLDIAWTAAGQSSPLTPRFGHTLAAVPSASGPKVYAIGGLGNGGEPLSVKEAVQVLDPALDSWSAVPVPKEPASFAKLVTRTGHACAAVGRTIVIYGGVVGGKVAGDVIVFDTRDGSWDASPTISGDPPPPRCNHTATVIGDAIYVFGGRSVPRDSANLYNDVWVLDWGRKAWSKAVAQGDPPPPRHSHSASVVPPQQQRILVFGGITEGEGKPNPPASADAWVLEVGTPVVKAAAGGAAPVVAWSRAPLAPPPKPVVICGPSGVGKGTLIAKLMGEFPDKCGFSVSHTTRKPRPGEQDGVHYNFSTREAMEADIAEGRFLEKADVHGNLYGTSVAAVQKVTDSGKMCILDIDVQGAKQVKQSPHISATFIFVSPPSFEELERRLRGRGTETEEQVEKRLKNAKEELERGQDRELFHHNIVNDDLEGAYLRLKGILGLGPKVEGEEGEEEATPVARAQHASASTGMGHVVLHGGLDGAAAVTPNLQVLDASSLTGGAPGLTWGLSCARLVPPPLNLWSSVLSVFGMLNENEAKGDGDPALPRSKHQAVPLGPSHVLLAGGTGAGGAAKDAVVLRLEKSAQ